MMKAMYLNFIFLPSDVLATATYKLKCKPQSGFPIETK